MTPAAHPSTRAEVAVRLATLHGQLAAIYTELASIDETDLTALAPIDAMQPVAIETAKEHALTTPPLLTATDFAQLLQVDPRTLREMTRAGDVPAPIRIGTRPRWRVDDVERWLAEACTGEAAHGVARGTGKAPGEPAKSAGGGARG